MSRFNTTIQMKNMTLKNRLVFPPMATSKSDHGEVNQSLLNYYREKSQSGYIGLMIVEHLYISDEGKASEHQVSIAKDADMAGLKALVDTIHQNGTPVFAQINHAGSKSIYKHKLSASAILHPFVMEGAMPQEMSLKDIQKVINDFVAAAKRVKEAGFDGVEIHGAHGYLLNQFYSPLTNHRHDQYGGTLQARIQLHLEIIHAIRKAVGDDYPIAMRFGACDYAQGGSTMDDAQETALLLEKAGIDLLDVSGGLRGYVRPGYQEPGYFSDITKVLKNNLSIPVLLTGGVKSGHDANRLLEQGYADLIGVGRAIFTDSNWAQKCMIAFNHNKDIKY